MHPLTKAIFAVMIVLFPAVMAGAAEVAPPTRELQLQDCVRLALTNNLDLAALRAEVDRLRASSRGVLTAYLPKVDANFTRKKTKLDSYMQAQDAVVEDESIGNTLNLTIQETLDLRGDVWRSYSRASDQLTAKQNEYDHQASATVLRVVELFYSMQQARDRIKNLELRSERQEALVKQVRVEVQVGKKAPVDLEELEHEAARIQLELLQAQQDMETTHKQLGVLIMGSERQTITIASTTTEPAYLKGWQGVLEKSAADSLRSALESRGDIQARQLNVEVARSQKQENYWSYVPELALTANYQRDFSRWSNDDEPIRPDVEWSYGLVATWNLFNGGADYYQLRQDASAERQAAFSLASATETGMIELKDARDKVKTNESLWRASEQLFRSSQKRHAAIKAQYDIGKRSITDLLQAQVDLSDAEIEVVKSKLEFYTQYAQYLHLTGQLRQLFGAEHE